ncbi:MAG: hypothetical protein V3R99_06105 [Thermoguttaceae bacterium]
MKRSRLIVVVSLLGLFAWLMGDALFRSGMFVFRDAAHYYYPLFELIRDQWAAGRVPLWNPYENLGMPLAADPTAGVFYPGKLIFALPLSYAWTYKLYIMAHLLLAAAAAYRLARHWRASVEAAGVCALSYAFSGNVLYNYCNIIYLVGAAWLPVAMLAADRMLAGNASDKRLRWAVVFGLVLALMVLGGDPQMAYNAGLLATMFAAWLWWTDRKRANRPGTQRQDTPQGSLLARLANARPTMLALAAGTGLLLSAVQVLPSLEFTSHSRRAAGDNVQRWLGHFEEGTHEEQIYHFSVGPWRLAEYVWPNVGGRQFPTHRRWLEVIPAEGRIWTPSLYMGVLPLLLALAAMRLRRGEARIRWLSWSVVLAVVASFGWFGLGWLIQEFRIAAGADPASTGPVGSPFGGLYWLMTIVLPGYDCFRYPAKLLVVAALGLSVLAARGWDDVFENSAHGFRRVLLWLAAVSIVGTIVALALRPFASGWLAGVEPDNLFGPLDTLGAANDLLGSFAQTAIVCGLFWWLCRKMHDTQRRAWPAMLAVVLVAVDLGVANRWMVVCAPSSYWTEPSAIAAKLHDAEQSYRVYRHPIWMRPSWKAEGSPNRPAEAMRWDHATLWPKYNLSQRIAVTEVYGAIMPHSYAEFLRKRHVEHPPRATGDRPEPFSPYALGKYAILPGNKTLPGGRRIDVDVPDVSLWHNPRHWPRAWVADQPDAPCRVVHDEPSQVEVEVALTKPGLVVLCDQFYPGWQLAVESDGKPSRPAEIERTNQTMRGVNLPAGKHRLTYRYRPRSLIIGGLISGLGWLVLAGACIRRIIASRRVRPDAP